LFPCGIRRGTLTEWLSEGPGTGTESLTLKLVSDLHGILMIVDSHHTFYPPAAAALGVALADTIIVRPRREADALWAVEQSLRCRGVGIVLARLNHVESRSFRRLQLAAEQGGAIGVLIRPASQRASPSWAQARFLVRALPSQPVGRRLQLESLHRDGGDVVELELNDATGAVCLVSRLAASTAVRRAAGA
jgi:protein ImuA